jgi:hypothetical protein
MALVSHPDPVRSKLNAGPLAVRLASLFAIRMPVLGCIRIAPEGTAACAVLAGAAVREPRHSGARWAGGAA